MAFDPGTRLGPYEVIAPLGEGGMGEVYRARDTRLDRTVAVKVLTGALASDAESRQRFEEEARAIAALNDPQVKQGFEAAGAEVMTMELEPAKKFLHDEIIKYRDIIIKAGIEQIN